MSQDICTGCRMAEVRSHIRARGRAGKTTPEALQQAHRKALESQLEKPRPLEGVRPAALLGVQGGRGFWQGSSVADAAQMACVLGKAPSVQALNTMFFSYAHRTFYRHMRTMLRTLSTPFRTKLSRTRKNPSAKHGPSPKAEAKENKALSLALRFTRIYLREECAPLALKLNCGQTNIWRIETAGMVTAPYWVERYAAAFQVPEALLYAFADALVGREDLAPKRLVALFVDTVLRGDGRQGLKSSRVWRYVSGAARHEAPQDERLFAI